MGLDQTEVDWFPLFVAMHDGGNARVDKRCS